MKTKSKSHRAGARGEFIESLILPARRIPELQFGVWDALLVVLMLFGSLCAARFLQ